MALRLLYFLKRSYINITFKANIKGKGGGKGGYFIRDLKGVNLIKRSLIIR